MIILDNLVITREQSSVSHTCSGSAQAYPPSAIRLISSRTDSAMPRLTRSSAVRSPKLAKGSERYHAYARIEAPHQGSTRLSNRTTSRSRCCEAIERARLCFDTASRERETRECSYFFHCDTKLISHGSRADKSEIIDQVCS